MDLQREQYALNASISTRRSTLLYLLRSCLRLLISPSQSTNSRDVEEPVGMVQTDMDVVVDFYVLLLRRLEKYQMVWARLRESLIGRTF